MILDAESGRPAVVGGIQVLVRLGALLGPGIERALAVEFAGAVSADDARWGSMSHRHLRGCQS